MAGPHQIWKLDLSNNEISTFAGSGREARLDGPLLESGFAQPSGMAILGQTLYIADSESNIIRGIDLVSGQVKTLVGGDLFEFGDIDGTGDDVRLQHPLGLLTFGDKLLIADTYNPQDQTTRSRAKPRKESLRHRKAGTSRRRFAFVLRTRRSNNRERKTLHRRH
jgi:hypothetical protein